MNDALAAAIAIGITSGTPVLIAATGELLAEKVGVYNIGLEGVMLLGAFGGFVATQSTDNLLVGLLAAGLVGAGLALVFGLVTVVFRADMIVAGIALILIALGATSQLGSQWVGQAALESIPVWNVPFLSDLPFVGRAFFQQPVMAYVAFLLPFAALFVLNYTRHGMNMRAIGEDPLTADSVGISVIGWRLFYVGLGGVLAGIAGAFLTLGSLQIWEANITNGIGWIAFAIVIFSGWRPLWLIAGAYLFGGAQALQSLGQAEAWPIASQIFTTLPYVVTVVVLIARTWLRTRERGALAWPAALGVPFYRDA